MTRNFSILFLLALTLIACKDATSGKIQPIPESGNKNAKVKSVDGSTLYRSDNLIVRKLSDHVYVHISYLNTTDYGKVACNGMLVVNENEGVVFDTPADNTSASELITFVADNLNSKIIAIIPTHFHQDCVGGIQMFEEWDIPAYVSAQTLALLKSTGQNFTNPANEFESSLSLSIGDKKVFAEYFGEGHTKDNIIGYFPADKAFFGGCLIKTLEATKGNLEDANTAKWPATVTKIRQKYPLAEIVIPGHGKWGGTDLFDYTITLFE